MDARALPFRPDLWVVAFVPADRLAGRPWWQRALSRRYRHVFAFRAAGHMHTEIVNHVGDRLSISVLADGADAFAAQLADQGIELLAVAGTAAVPRAMLRGPMTCVEVTKALLGLRGFWILTPRQLAALLVRRGAQIVLPTSQPTSQKEPAPWVA